jgi:Ubiquitin-activating enzyme E1 FCCH domain
MASPLIQAKLNAGELSPAIYGRVDLAKYREGCTTLRNMFSAYTGGAKSRAGTKFVGYSRQSTDAAPPQLIPFQFSVDQGYLLIFSHLEMSVVVNGAYVLNDPVNITAIASAATGTFSTSTAHGFSTTDWVFIADVEGLTELNDQMFAVNTTPTTTSFTLKSILTDAVIDTTTYSAYTTGGTAASLFILDTPYVSGDLAALKWAQSADVMSITHPSYRPADIARISLNNWTYTTTGFSASILPPSTLSATATTITTTLITQYQYVVTSVDDETDEESIASPVATARNSVDIAQTAGASSLLWPSVTGASRYNVYKSLASVNGIAPIGSLFGYAGSAFGLTFVDSNIQQDMTVTPPKHFNPFASGSITAFTITATGSGWSNIIPPTVTITDSSGTGAVGTAVVTVTTGTSGSVQAIIVESGGQNYNNPTISIAYQSGTGATFSPVANGNGLWDGGTAGTTVNSAGTGYTLTNATIIAQYPFPVGSDGTTTTLFAKSYTLAGSGIATVTFPFTGEDQKPEAAAVKIFAIGASTTTASATATIGPTTGTYPSVVAYWQQRRFYANTVNNPDTYFASQPGAFTNFDYSVPSNAADAVTGTPWAQQVNGIAWMIPMPGGLVVLTGLGAWQLSGGSESAAFTPDNQIATAQAYNGCKPLIKPITINYDILYVQQKGSIVRNFAYDFFTNIYTGADLTVLSSHLFTNFDIVRWDWAEEPNKLVWAIRDDGKMLSMTYMRAQSQQDEAVFSWARHDTNGLFQSIAVVTEPPVDAPYFVVKRFPRT